jgi:hypothetical protein
MLPIFRTPYHPVPAAIALALAQLFPTEASAQSEGFAAIDEEVGCRTRYGEEKAANEFATKYAGKEMTVSGQVSSVSRGTLRLKVLPATITFDLQVELADLNAGYDLEKGQRVTVRFVMRRAGRCYRPFEGDQGVIVKP